MNNQSDISKFVDQIRFLHEPEYGDFKRKVGTYLLRLQQELDMDSQKRVIDLLEKILQEVIFSATGDVEQARHLTVQTLEQIQARLKH